MRKCAKKGCYKYLSNNSDSYFCEQHEIDKYKDTLPVLTISNKTRKERVIYE